jgi:hypothetical protein
VIIPLSVVPGKISYKAEKGGRSVSSGGVCPKAEEKVTVVAADASPKIEKACLMPFALG